MRLLRLMILSLAGLALLVVLLVGGALLLIDRPGVRAALRPRLETLLSDALRLDVKIGDIAGLSLTKGVRVTGVTLSNDGEQMIAADALHVRLGLERLLPPLISIRAEGEGVAAHLQRRADGTWNLVEAFSSEEEAEKSPPPAWLDAITVVLKQGRVRIAGLAEPPLDVAAIDGEMVVVLGEPGRLTVERLAAKLGQASAFTAQGWLELGAPSGVELALDVQALSGADLKPLVPQLAADAAVSGTVQVTGSLDEPAAELHLASGPGTIDLWARLDETAAGQRIDGSWQVLALDPASLVVDAPPASVSGAGNLDVTLGDPWPSALAADARFWATSVADVAADWLTAQARRDGERILLDVQLAAPGGAASAELASWVGVTAPHPAGADLTFALLRPAELPEPLPAALADSELRGRLTATADRLSPDDRALKADLQLEPGRLRGVALDRALARAQLEAGVVSLDELRVEGGATRLLAWGWTQLEGTPETRQLRAGFVGPIDLGLVPGARGKIASRGSAWGTLASLGAEGSVASDGNVVLPGASGTFTVTARGDGIGSSQPAAQVKLRGRLEPDAEIAAAIGDAARDLDVDLAWRKPRAGDATLTVAATAGEEPPHQVSIELAASEPDRRKHAFAGMVELRGETVAVRLDSLRVTPPRGPAWTLLQTAQVSYAPDRIAAQRLEIGSRVGRFTVDGTLVRDGRNDLALTVSDLDLKAICQALELAECGGVLDAALRLAGTTKSPDLSGNVRARGLALAGQGYGGAQLAIATEERLVVRGALGQAPLGPLDLTARVPLTRGWPLPSPDVQGRFDATVTGNDIQLAGFRAFAESALTELSGQADVEVTATGTLASPRLAGGITATGIGLGLAATGSRWRDGRVRVSFADQSLRLDELSFRDGQGGAVTGAGTLLLTEDAAGAGGDLTITLTSLDVVARPEMDARASGRIHVGGSVARPRLTGAVRIDSATIRPAFLLAGAGPPVDPTIEIVYAGTPPASTTGPQATLAGPKPAPPAAPPPAAFIDRVSMAITVTLGDPVAVQRVDAYVRLGGEVYVTKEPGDALRVSGEISAQRGWYLFRGRRIVLQSAFASFSGETPIDPYLTVNATYQAPEHVVIIRVEGTATRPELELSSEPALDQGDVLALLLFGRTTSQLTGGQGTELRQEAIGILASYVAPELEQSLMDTFGLASLTFQLPTGTSYGSVGVGRYLGDDIFVSIGQTFGGPQGGTARQLGGLVGSSITVQYYLTPSITLQTSSSTEGESALDAVWHRRY